jgi:hypothetical protein
MPVKVVERGGKFRIVDPNGQLTRNDAGTPVDGSGHDNKRTAEKQAAAINAMLHRQGKI